MFAIKWILQKVGLSASRELTDVDYEHIKQLEALQNTELRTALIVEESLEQSIAQFEEHLRTALERREWLRQAKKDAIQRIRELDAQRASQKGNSPSSSPHEAPPTTSPPPPTGEIEETENEEREISMRERAPLNTSTEEIPLSDSPLASETRVELQAIKESESINQLAQRVLGTKLEGDSESDQEEDLHGTEFMEVRDPVLQEHMYWLTNEFPELEAKVEESIESYEAKIDKLKRRLADIRAERQKAEESGEILAELEAKCPKPEESDIELVAVRAGPQIVQPPTTTTSSTTEIQVSSAAETREMNV